MKAMARGRRRIPRRDFCEVGSIGLDDYVPSLKTLLIHMIAFDWKTYND